MNLTIVFRTSAMNNPVVFGSSLRFRLRVRPPHLISGVSDESCGEPMSFAPRRSPDTARIKSKMMYASSKDFLKSHMEGLAVELQVFSLLSPFPFTSCHPISSLPHAATVRIHQYITTLACTQ